MPKSGTYRLYIRGEYTAIKMNENSNAAKALTAEESWGNMVWSNMNGAFQGCSNLLSLPAAAPNLTLVTSMANMFNGASSFNSPINNWNTSNVTSMSYMFSGASTFNNPVDNWNTSNVTRMDFLFSGAAAFNQPVLNWNFEKLTDMSGMLNAATAFNQNIGSWQLKEGINLVNFFNSSGIDCENYGLTLRGWAQNASTPSNLTLGAVTRQYASDALPYRNILIAKGWLISDAGVASGCNLPLPVTLTKYAVKLQAGTVLISWQTVAEVNNSHFVLERSTDGIRFSFLKQIVAGFGGNAASNYSYTDAYPDNGNNYYRLTQVDLDDAAHNHGIKTVYVPFNKEPSIVYPNPVSQLPVTVKFKPNLYNKANLFNVNGLLIDYKNITGSDQPVRFDVQQLLPGTYVIQLSGKETSVHQFVKQ
ncbi:BspA family leucine-rich repeat surface protein [Dyadobacter sp. LHD-138]|uniref:BspA family leucine-rich repeat surface protein n=1 Tax=Dyadobacter sp. LHD-138 TaxID=3071413 RepID=UPI0027E16899|nr:BspA family leucine-rich repeat surface protein [Dyadobacter sp. LHD-138]MDQ6479393.1 BspA family leucine-rich repeat surface protein [Dyadobacter sp. LHD-138]